MGERGDLPLLQDTVAESAWHYWDVEYRDVVVLDELNVPVAVYNLTDNDLAISSNYYELLGILYSAAVPEEVQE